MNKVKVLLALAVIIIIGLLGVYATTIWPTQGENKTSAVPTESISDERSVGGVAVDRTQKRSQSSKNKAESTPPEQPVATATEPVAFEQIAPKQAEIRRSTPIEYEYKALRISNDPLPQPSWALNAVKAQPAWDSATGNGVVVAVIDSGFALTHEDLIDRWQQNVGETGMTVASGRCWTGTSVSKSTNNCDDDGNGYQDDWRGWDFVGGNNSPQAGEADPNGLGVAHGTQVAGLVGATGNNGVGTATVAWNNMIMPLQALGDDGSGFTSSVTAAVYYAVDNGASIINMSLGGTTNDATLARAVKYAYDRGVVVVAAAGNCGTGSEQGCDPASPGAMGYPALNEYVIAVGATGSDNVRASFSSYGPGLDVSAPGSGTLVSPMWRSDNQTSAYATSLYGTSFASPIVASYIGLIKSIRPSSSVDDITAIVNASASKPAVMGSEIYTTALGHGIIDAEAGLRVASSLNGTTGTPELLQAGSTKSEHTFGSGMTLASGCRVASGAYCTVWAKDTNGYDRFLPYVQSNGSGQAGWSWPSSWLDIGDWSLRARSGDSRSLTPYQLFRK